MRYNILFCKHNKTIGMSDVNGEEEREIEQPEKKSHH